MKIIFEVILLALVLISAVFLIFFYQPIEKPEDNNLLLKSFLKNNERILKKLTLEQKIGQLFIIGVKGQELTPETENLVKQLHPGGILLLDRNIKNEEQLKELIESLQKIALEDTGLPLFIAVDQEGGKISRIDWVESTAQFQIETPGQAEQIGKKRGEELKELGINLNLAPLLDITSSGDFIHQRTFQKTPEQAEELASGLIKGQKESGIITCIKHFPGYSGISFNPEEELAVVEKIPGIPQFKQAIKEKPEIVMASNVIYKELDDKPFSFSEKGAKLLKEELGNRILIISDDLAQNSLLDEFSLNDIVSLPIKAGADLLIFSGWRISIEKGISALKQAFEQGKISQKQINQAVLRIIELKERVIRNL